MNTTATLTTGEENAPRCRNSDPDELMLTVRELGEALHSIQHRSQKWLAWQQLNVIGEHGVNDVTPYTRAAIATLEALYALDEGEGDVIHHLAIAYHAMAWDLELRDPAAAAIAWEQALFYWRRLHGCGAFWQDLCAKGEALGKEFNRSVVEELRHDLIQNLLEIHVDFIRHYHNLQKPDQALRHISLIQRARIPPAARKKLELLVYEAMTSAVPQSAAEGRFDEALAILDSFLRLFPDYLTALQLYLEITRQWLDQMSPASQWQKILDLDRLTEPRCDTLEASTHLSEYPLAHAALGSLAGVMGGKHWAKARSLRLQREEAKQQPQQLGCEEYLAYERAIAWLRKAASCTPQNLEDHFNLLNTLMARAGFLACVGMNSDDPDMTYRLLEQALSDCQEAMRLAPDEVVPRQGAAGILRIRVEYRLKNLPESLHALDLVAYLRSIEKDALEARQLDLQNTDLRDLLDQVQDALRCLSVR